MGKDKPTVDYMSRGMSFRDDKNREWRKLADRQSHKAHRRINRSADEVEFVPFKYYKSPSNGYNDQIPTTVKEMSEQFWDKSDSTVYFHKCMLNETLCPDNENIDPRDLQMIKIFMKQYLRRGTIGHFKGHDKKSHSKYQQEVYSD
jgi:hypothetical protein